ncbi:hypothetical protein [Mesorhizobium sp.]|uniref:hypothetical protein n=1 Tax=Mesorhizobium sp. TaxID=1871066 RepID=UPI000FE41C25|nr:hypothetical protein [Mesorhizobium sp.]RWN56691.1 MAG: hypothetical protein EOR98_09200 [Mesorhizobium sp.]RWN78202.1 MAG: hypothetical protein EOS02_10680 [Mesorhizobium sp.]RWN82143.1 MAG: hypothetical protein EOS01_09255 [Mesorhizobium sp.]RWN91510.1 MAG: hypothetical protein EOS04_05225 [Mesorhizobium sp.]RWO15933.1 MAG: hypothetical protein EOS15_09270 [Mesorhizobium sp.]
MTPRRSTRLPGGWILWLLVPAGLLLFGGANAHLAYVAFQSQPDCVAHVKDTSDGGGYRAAKSAC